MGNASSNPSLSASCTTASSPGGLTTGAVPEIRAMRNSMLGRSGGPSTTPRATGRPTPVEQVIETADQERGVETGLPPSVDVLRQLLGRSQERAEAVEAQRQAIDLRPERIGRSHVLAPDVDDADESEDRRERRLPPPKIGDQEELEEPSRQLRDERIEHRGIEAWQAHRAEFVRDGGERVDHRHQLGRPAAPTSPRSPVRPRPLRSSRSSPR